MRSFALLDHKCSELEKLLKEKMVSYKWAVCGCSPWERHYQILEEGKWRNLSHCPFCGDSMIGGVFGQIEKMDISDVQFEINGFKYPPIPVENFVRKKRVQCPKCDEMFEITEVIE